MLRFTPPRRFALPGMLLSALILAIVVFLSPFGAGARNSPNQQVRAQGFQDAQRILSDNTLKGTPFDGGSPPLHAGP